MFFDVMKLSYIKVLITAVLLAAQAQASSFKSVKAVDSFVDSNSWVLFVNGKEKNAVDFQSNHTLPAGKAVKLGSKEYRFWSVIKHPTVKGAYQLRIHSQKTAGWHSFNWDAGKKAWTSKHWPKHQIRKK